ncbi:MAG TPA: SDR family oxidoreductase [Polyangiales bacterium]|nr:SDR family oxidoreductase [Polyangiales bacterium]
MTQPLAIVTGANGNLGKAVVARLKADGMRVAEVERSRMLFEGAPIADVDLGDAASVRRAFTALPLAGTRLQAVVHTVGTFRSTGTLSEAADQDFLELFQTNVMTSVHVIQAAIGVMLPQGFGRIAVVASADALAGQAKRAAYSASKAAQLRVVESAAAELRGTNITLNAVLPGTMDTPQNRSAMPKADPAKWVKLEEVADALSFLVSERASAVHGQALRVERS